MNIRRKRRKRSASTAAASHIGSRFRTLRYEQCEDRRLLSVDAPQLELFKVSPALFVENQGQWADESVRFVHQGDGANVAMTDGGVQFQVFRNEEIADTSAQTEDAALPELPGRLSGLEDVATETLQFAASFVGANTVAPVGQDQVETVFNYFVGAQENWHSGVTSYAVVAYQGLYDGIDLKTWGQRDSLKYEFHVAPGADYTQIQVHYSSIVGLALGDDGSLRVNLGGQWGELVDDAPYIYQVIDGQQVAVAGRFELIDACTYTFVVTGSFDAARELVIDPDLAWASYLGGVGHDNYYGYCGIAVDATGNSLLTGNTYSNDFPTPDGFDTNLGGGVDVFVAKVTAAGALVWASYLGGSSADYGHGIDVDAAGNMILTGETNSSDFPTLGGFDEYCNGGYDAFVAKVTAGGTLAWASYLGGSGTDVGRGIAVDTAGNSLVTGFTISSDFPTPGGFDTDLDYWSTGDAFVAKVTAGGDLAWASYLGGGRNDYGNGIAVDAAGNVLLTGETWSPDFPTPDGFDRDLNPSSKPT